MTNLDRRAISAALFLPALYWTGAVIATTLFGYPAVICMTPLAWLLALPIGMRVPHESISPGNGPVIEAAVSGALLGIWQGLLFALSMALTTMLPQGRASELPNALLLAGLALLLGTPITASLAAWIAWVKRRS